MLMKLFELPTLKEFKIQNCSFDINDGLCQGLGRRYHPSSRELETAFSDHYSQGAKTHFYLSVLDASISVTKSLLRWPAWLTRLTLNQFLSSAYNAQYTAQVVQDLLEVHLESLQYIKLCIIPSERCGSPNFAHFTALQTLHLNKHNMFFDTPLKAYRRGDRI